MSEDTEAVVAPPDALWQFLNEHREITQDVEPEYERLLAENDAYVGACQYQGNTVSYIKSKADNYGRQLVEAHRAAGAPVGTSIVEYAATLKARAEATESKMAVLLEALAEIAECTGMDRADNPDLPSQIARNALSKAQGD